MNGYTKLFSSILASTVWREDDKTRIVWITLLAMADRHGVAEGSVPGLADFARVSIDDCRAALEKLQQPDTDSRSKEFEGRRIQAVDGGWQILNHGKYRAKLSQDERREYLRIKQQEYRRKQASTTVNNVSDTLTVLTQAEADTKAEEQREKSAAAPPSLSPSTDPFTDRATTERAGRFIERYEALYRQHRHGARYAVRPARDYAAAVTLCRTWPDDSRLEKLAICFLTTDHKFAEEGSRTIPQFLALASWADGELAKWEQQER